MRLEIEIEGDFDTDAYETEVECPQCGFYNAIWLKQARLRDTIICRGCKANLHLEDGMNTVRKARSSIMRSLKRLEAEIERVNRQFRR